MLFLLRCLLRFLSRWPLAGLQALGAVLGWLSYGLSPSYRQRFDANLAQAGLAPGVGRAAVAEAGKLVAELPFLWLRPADQPLSPRVQWQGADLVEAALAKQRGLIFLTPHMGCFEATAQAYAEQFGAQKPITVLYRPARKAWLRALVDTARLRPGLMAAPATLTGVRQMLRALRRGEAVGLLPDQVPPEGMGQWAPFFGKPAYTMTLAARLARQSGAAVLLAWGERLPRGRGFVVHISPFDHPLPEGDGPQAQAESAAAINQALEGLIHQCPGQYLWGYHRYKAPRAEGPQVLPPAAPDPGP